MNHSITSEERLILDSILPYFELNEVINVKKSIRASMTEVTAHNTPVNTYADKIKGFLIKYQFAKNLAGEAVIKSKGIALKNAGSLRSFEKVLQNQHDFVLIDDDNINNIICSKIISKASPNVSIQGFFDPNAGLRHLHAIYSKPDAKDVIILLDINMPTLMGWDVLDEINTFSDKIKNHFRIFMLTSSVNSKDKERAENIPILWGYIEKPLTDSKIKNIFSEH